MGILITICGRFIGGWMVVILDKLVYNTLEVVRFVFLFFVVLFIYFRGLFCIFFLFVEGGGRGGRRFLSFVLELFFVFCIK